MRTRNEIMSDYKNCLEFRSKLVAMERPFPWGNVDLKVHYELVKMQERLLRELHEFDMNNMQPYVYVDNSPAPMHIEAAPESIPGIIFINSDGYRGSDLESSHDCSCGACKE